MVRTTESGTNGASAGEILQLIREGRAKTRSDLGTLTGLARSTVSQRIDALMGRSLVYEAGEGPSQGGRPPVVLAFNQKAGVVLAADFGATHCRLAVTDLGGDTLAEFAGNMAIAEGPDVVLDWMQDRFDGLLEEAERAHSDVLGIGVGLPGPVEFAAGRAVNPPIMPGWDGVVVPDRLAERYPVPVLVDNDVNIMALGEYWTNWRDTVSDLLFVKVGTGIGCGIVAGGRIHRGAQGSAGDLGHVRVSAAAETFCRCGNRGCVEAAAGGGAIARQLAELGYDAANSRDVVRLVRAGNADALRLVREGGRLLGEVLASAVNFFNPAVIVIGGDLAAAEEQMLAGVRELVYERSAALATHHLKIERSRLGDRAGVIGAAVMIIESVLSVEAVDAAIDRGTLVRSGR